ncbi:MAG: YbgC/FadM family acyl-CoA thioesterase [Pseudomonadota bacterium]
MDDVVAVPIYGRDMDMPNFDQNAFDSEGRHWKRVRVYYEDTDFTGMVYHANYLRFFERGRSDFLRDAGVSHVSLLERDDPAAFTIIRAEIDFKAAARIDDTLDIVTTYGGAAGAEIFFSQKCFRGETLIAGVEITAVQIHADGRPRRLIAELVDRLARIASLP